MSNLSQIPLSKSEIEEELVNNEILSSGGVEDENCLHNLNLEEKRELLKGIQKSKEDYRGEANPRTPSLLDSSNFPSLSSASKSTNNRSNKPGLKLPRKTSTGVKAAEASGSSPVIDLRDDDEEPKIEKFCLPGCINDNAPPLVMPERPVLKVDCPFYVMEGESAEAALRRMLNAHDKWKKVYYREMRKLEQREPSEPEDDVEEIKSSSRREVDTDIYEFHSDSPVQKSKVYLGTKSRNLVSSAAGVPSASGASQIDRQRRTSRDSDCTEVEPILKIEDSKLGDWATATNPRYRNKRNRKQLTGEQEQAPEKGKTQDRDAVPDIDFGFDEQWDARTTQWRSPSSAQSGLNNSTIARRSLGRPIPVEEEKVQCPICQQAFPKSKVENHAANCEGYSDSPMDVEDDN